MAKLCARHEASLIEELKRKGIWFLCYSEKEHVNAFKHRWLNGESVVGEFNPYVVAVLEINQKAVTHIGAYTQESRYCACCEVQKKLGEDADDVWLDNVTDAMLQFCLVNGLMGNHAL